MEGILVRSAADTCLAVSISIYSLISSCSVLY